MRDVLFDVWFFSFGFSRRLLGYLSQMKFEDVVSGFPHHTEVSAFPQNFGAVVFKVFHRVCNVMAR